MGVGEVITVNVFADVLFAFNARQLVYMCRAHVGNVVCFVRVRRPHVELVRVEVCLG